MAFPTDIIRVSVATDGTEGERNSENPSISGDGRYVTFSSGSGNLDPGDTNNRGDIFMHDRATGVTRRVSVATDGTEGDQRSSFGSISENGRYVAFQSGSTNFVTTYPNYDFSDIFVHDLQTGETELITVPMAGTVYVNGHSSVADISGDGRYVTYYSPAFSLVPGDTADTGDIYVYDRQLGITTRINETVDGDWSNTVARNPAISDSGGYIAFETNASDLTVGDTNGQSDIFVRNLDTDVTDRISVATDGTQGDGSSQQASISADGRYVAFRSYATNLVAEDNNGRHDIFLHDRVTGITTRISVATDGTEGNRSSDDPSISADGRYVTFSSEATNLVAEDSNFSTDIFIYDHLTGMIQRASVAVDGSEATNRSAQASISADGRVITFTSRAPNLVAGDTNGHDDIFTISNPLFSNDSANTLNGTEGNDRFFGLGGNDTISGVDGNDSLDGDAGNDALSGGDGNDVLIGGEGDDTLTGGTGDDTLDGGDGTDNVVFNVASTAATFSEIPGALVMTSADGADTIRSSVENLVFTDTSITYAEALAAANSAPTDGITVTGTAGNDTLDGGQGNDTLEGLDGNDLLRGSAGNDSLLGGDGVDTLIGGAGDDFIFGGSTSDDLRDVIYGGDGHDNIDGGYGNDELRGDAGNDSIAGGFGADTVIGGAGDDVLTGSAYSDVIFGGDGMDFVNGGFGHDRVNGGADGDRFYHLGIADHGSDWIQDYNAAEGDVLMWGGAAATAANFQINTADTANAGVDGVSESFIIYRPTGQIMWALVDGDAQDEINIQIGGQVFDLLG